MNKISNQGFRSTLSAGWTLGARAIRIQIAGHILGYAWNFIIPAIYALCYIYVRQAVLGNKAEIAIQDWWDIIRVFSGLTLFQSWYQTLQDTSAFITTNRGMLRGMSVGVLPFVIAIAIESSLAMLIRLLTIFVAIFFLGVEFSITAQMIAWVSLCFFSLLTSAIAIGLVLSPWATLFADVRKALQSFSLPIVLVTPIFYPPVFDPDFLVYWIQIANPLAPPLIVLQQAISGSEVIFADTLAIWTLAVVVIMCASALHIQKQVPILLERMGN